MQKSFCSCLHMCCTNNESGKRWWCFFLFIYCFFWGGKLLDCSFPCDFSHERPNETRLQRHVSKCASPPPYWNDTAALLPAQVLYFSPRMHPQPPTWHPFYLLRFSGTTGSRGGTTCHKARNRGHLNLLSATVSGLKLHFHCKNKLLSDLMHIPKACLAVVFLLSFIRGGR